MTKNFIYYSEGFTLIRLLYKARSCKGFTLFSRNERAFTLIELLVSISIIAILAAIGLISYSSVRGNARDSARRSEIQSIAAAIEAKKNTDGTYNLSAADLVKEFPDNSNFSTTKANDPSGNPYCINTSTSTVGVPTLPTVDWTATTCPLKAAWVTAAGAETTGDLLTAVTTGALGTSTAKSWTICARTENAKNKDGRMAFCMSSGTR